MAQMIERSSIQTKVSPKHRALGLTDEETLDFYAKMVLVRTLDERLWALNRQGKVPIVASVQGHEAAGMASAWAAIKDGDHFLFPYYRGLSLKIMAGMTPLEAMLSHVGKAGDPFSGGRQFPLQGAFLKNRIIQISNVVTSGLNHAVGYALGCKLLREKTVVLVYFGDGATSQGECHEAMNFAGIYKLPVIFICENNKFAISVPQSKQMSLENVASRAVGYGFPGVVVDGADAFEVYQRTQEAIERARSPSGGPTFLEMKVERLMPHTSDDDQRRYRSQEELEGAHKRDPVLLLQNHLINEGLMTQEQDAEIRANAKQEINRATEAVEKEPWPDTATFYDHLYAP